MRQTQTLKQIAAKAPGGYQGFMSIQDPDVILLKTEHRTLQTFMLHSFFSQLIDEVVGNALLHLFLRYRHRAPVAGPSRAACPQIYSGELRTFFSPAPTAADFWSQRIRVAENETQSVWDFSFPSEIATGWPESDRVWGRYWQSRAADRGLTVVSVNGIVQVGSGWFQSLAERLNPCGVDLVMMDAPFNFRRTPRGYRPGQLILGGDLAHQLAVARQSVLDLWRVVFTLQQAGRRVGLVGLSHGGWLALMTSLLAEQLAFVISLVPPVDIVRLLGEGGTVVRAVRRGLGRAPLDIESVSKLARPLIPGEWKPQIPGDAIVLHAARYDRFVPWRRIVELSEKWSTRLVVHDEAHYRLAVAPEIIPLVASQVCEYLNAVEGRRR